MKIYKFRSLANCDDYSRLLDIIKHNHFRCSYFKDMNDPMEGFFLAQEEGIIEEIFSEKMKYKICSFSGEKGFKNPALRGYYANGFKGVAIEVEFEADTKPDANTKLDANKGYIESITYDDKIGEIESLEDIEKILCTKLKAWEHEHEYRFIKKTEGNKIVIGDIKAIYFGDPYHNIKNKDYLIDKNYTGLEKRLTKDIKRLNKEIKIYNVYFDKNATLTLIPEELK